MALADLQKERNLGDLRQYFKPHPPTMGDDRVQIKLWNLFTLLILVQLG